MMIQLNINVHGTGRKELVLLFYLLGKIHTHRVAHCPLHRIIEKLHPILEVTSTILPKRYSNLITRHEQNKKYCHMQHLLEIKENKQKTEKLLSYPILCPLWHLYQRKYIIMKLMQFGIYFNVADQVHIVNKKSFYKTWTFDRSSQKYISEMVYQTTHC